MKLSVASLSEEAKDTVVLSSKTLRVVLALLAVYVVWSSTYLALRVLVHDMPALLSSGARQVCAGILLYCIARFRGVAPPTRAQWLRAVPVGALIFAGGNGFVALSERWVPSGIAAVACATTPLWAAALSSLWGERASRAETLGLGFGFMGVLLLCGASVRSSPVGALALLAMAPLCWALGSLLSRRWTLASGAMSPASSMLMGGFVTLALGLVTGEHWSVPSRGAVVAWAYLVVFGSVLAFSAYNYLLQNTRPSVAMSYAYVNPALAVLLGALLGGEAVQGLTVVSLLAVVVALVLVMRASKR